MKKQKIAVIGGGASGMMAAIIAGKNNQEIVLFEQNDRVGKKILATGNGKCNFSNVDISSKYYYTDDSKKLDLLFDQFTSDDIINFFTHCGMMVKEKNGYLYPKSEQASTVLDILRIQLNKSNITINTEEKIEDIYKDDKQKFVVKSKQNTYLFDKVILSTGGKAAPKTGSDGSGYKIAQKLGHSIHQTVPALVQLRCKENYLKVIKGVREDAFINLLINGKLIQSEKGEIQFTDYGISGIVVFQISRIAAYALKEGKKVTVLVDGLPGVRKEEIDDSISRRFKIYDEDTTVEEFFTGMLNKKIMSLFITLSGLKSADKIRNIDYNQIRNVFTLCKEFPLTVTGTNSFEDAQVTAGGIPLSEVNNYMESTKVPGLYFTGELLDVDGKCGGYNLHWAWTSAYIAANYASKQD